MTKWIAAFATLTRNDEEMDCFVVASPLPRNDGAGADSALPNVFPNAFQKRNADCLKLRNIRRI
ncbi:hypothetical protein [Helicobacter sp. 23-1045]